MLPLYLRHEEIEILGIVSGVVWMTPGGVATGRKGRSFGERSDSSYSPLDFFPKDREHFRLIFGLPKL